MKEEKTFTPAGIAHCPVCLGNGLAHAGFCPACEGHGHVTIKNVADLEEMTYMTPAEEERLKVLRKNTSKTDAERAELNALENRFKSDPEHKKDAERIKTLQEKKNKTSIEVEELRDLENKNK